MCSATSSAAARRGGGRSQVFRGADLRYELELDLDQAVFGHTVEIELPKLDECETCHGTGAAKGSQPVDLRDLRGRRPGAGLPGFFQLQQTCPRCRGAGTIVTQSLRHLPGPGAGAAQPRSCR